MSSTAADGRTSIAERLGIAPGMVVWQYAADDDIDTALVEQVAERAGSAVVDGDDPDLEDAGDVVDVVLLWYREDDGDLVDALVDTLPLLGDDGVIWLLTPKVGRAGHVEASDILEAAPTAGLSQTSTLNVGANWTASRLTSKGQLRKK